jgi:predicted acetyltransferase
MPEITLRPVQDGDLPQLVNLNRLAFAPLCSNTDLERDWYGGRLDLPDRRIFLAVDDPSGQAIGGYAQLDLHSFFQAQVFPVMGITAVAVAPHRRGQKIARLMLDHALQEARSRQIPIVMLYPFQHGFYRRLGWAWVERMHQYRVSTRQLPLYQQRSQVVPYTPSQHQTALQAIYQQAAVQHNGWLQRQSWQWQNRLKPDNGKEIYCYIDAGELLGYVILQFTQLDPPRNILAVVVQEWVALTNPAYRGIVGFLASLRDQVLTVVWNTYPADPFPSLLHEQRRDPALTSVPFEFGFAKHFGEIGGGFMWRLVDLETAVHLRPVQPTEPFILTFEVTDPVLGDRSISIQFLNGQMQLVSQTAPVVIQTSVEHLTELFCGVRRAIDLQWTGEIIVTGTHLQDADRVLHQLDSAWQATPPFCWDFF